MAHPAQDGEVLHPSDRMSSSQPHPRGSPGPTNQQHESVGTLTTEDVYSSQGGVRAFANGQHSKKQRADHHDNMRVLNTQDLAAFVEDQPQDNEGTLDHEMVSNSGPVANADPTPAPSPASLRVHVIKLGDVEPTTMRVPPGTTVGNLVQAELPYWDKDQFVRATNAIGRFLPPQLPLEAEQQIFLNVHDESYSNRGVSHLQPGNPPFLQHTQPISRMELLHRQGPWVEAAEFDHYLQMITHEGQAGYVPPCVVPFFTFDDELVEILMSWATECITHLSQNMTVASGFLVHDHWFPVLLKQHAMGLSLITTPEAADWVDIAFQAYTHQLQVKQSPLPWSHRCDCGFQSIGWIQHQIKILRGQADPSDTPPVADKQAIAWRTAFGVHLHRSDKHSHQVVPAKCRFGGTGQQDLTTFLQEILQQHGVPAESSSQRAQSVLETLGRQQVTQAMRSNQPWRDLKAMANHARPRVQLVMPGELSDRIQQRVANPQEFGSRRKKKAAAPQDKGQVQLHASDLRIPQGIFREQGGDLLQQIAVTALGPDTKGIVVTDFSQAAPYANLPRPFSKRGLAIVVIDSCPECEQLGQEVRFPATCERTAEPVIITARLLQLGQIPVVRHEPENVGVVEEVDTCVVRVLMYRDEHDQAWDTFLKAPVKHVINAFEQLQPRSDGTQRVIDCWDRQYLTLRLEKTKPQDADLFVVTFRLEGVDLKELLSCSGEASMYIEPRDVSGKEPALDYRVIWLTKQDKSSSRVAKQSTPAWTSLVRSGQRYGVRTTKEEAARVHQLHKPHTPFLDSTAVRVFQVGPWPYGATKATIHKVFQGWQWEARPVQPRTRAIGGSGLMWEVHAAAAPAFDGSQRTIAALTVPTKTSKERSADPWETQDPWAHYEGVTKQPKTTPESQSRVASVGAGALAQQIEDRVLATVDKKLASYYPSGDDELMPETERITELESRLNKLEVTVQTHHAAQVAQAQTISAKVEAVQARVESQAESMRNHMDQRMKEQLTHIEVLLSKRHKTGSE
eukprot:Skav227302  [mRNA]  locus=scaffold2645:251397:254536:- [translate_table: standard]